MPKPQPCPHIPQDQPDTVSCRSVLLPARNFAHLIATPPEQRLLTLLQANPPYIRPRQQG